MMERTPTAGIVVDSKCEMLEEAKSLYGTATNHLSKGVECYRQFGSVCIRIKSECKHGEWKKIVPKLPCSYRQVRKYMQLAKMAQKATLEEAWAKINGSDWVDDDPDEGEAEQAASVASEQPAEATQEPLEADEKEPESDVTTDQQGESPPATPPEKPKCPTDDLGIPIQEHAAEAFKACAKFDELRKLLKDAAKLYGELADMPGGAYLRRPGVSINSRESWKHRGIQDAIAALEDCKPSITVCPMQFHSRVFPESKHQHTAECVLCHGLNWSRKLGKSDVVDRKVLDAVKVEYGVSDEIPF